MAGEGPTTIAEYIQAAPRGGQPHLRHLYAILKSKPLPEDLVRKIAEYRLQVVSQRKDDSFW